MRRLFTALTILCTALALHAEIVRVYCRMNYSWWTEGDAAIAAYAFADGEGAPSNAGWPGQAMTNMYDGQGTWYIDLENVYTKIIFARVSSDGELSYWSAQTADLDFPTGEDRLYVITSETAVWHDNTTETVTGYWTTYTEGGDPTGNPTGGDTGETTIYTTTFQDWESQTVTTQMTFLYSGIEFTVNNVKVMPTQTPSGVSGASAGYIQPNTASAMSSSYVQTGLLSNVSTVRFTHAAATVGNGWRLESSSDGVNFYAFNENETGCSTAKVAEEKEVYVFMDNVYLRWTPITTGGNNTSIYLTEITINFDGSGNAGGNPSMGDELTYNITLYAPDACPEMKPGICGTFNSWSTPIPMTLLTDNEGRTYYSYSFQSNPGDAFKIREQNDTDWSNQLQQNVDGNWENFENYTLTEQTEIVLDHSNNSMYRFSQCTDGGNYTYSVVGTANLFGNEWDVTDTRTEMLPYGDHMYAYTIDSVTLRTDGDYQYKVIANHAWNVQEWPSVVEDDNYHINVEDPGVYQVLFLLDPNTGCSATTNYLHAIIEEQPQLTSKSWHISPLSPYDSDNLRLTMAEALSGDTIFLADGIYNESNMNYLAFTKNLLLMAEAGASPVIRPQTPFTISNGANAQMIDIKIDASNLNAANTYDHLIYSKDDNEANGLYMVRCELYNFTNNNSAIYCSSANTLSACFFLDCYIHDMTKTVMFFENESLQQLTISGSTFANITTNNEGYYAAVIDARGANTSVYVDHCTFYNCQVMNSDYGAIKASNASDVIVTNSIFAMPESYDTGRSVYANSGTVGFCIMYNYTKDSGLGIHSGPDISNCSSADPMFVDAANGDFTLGAGSPAYSASNEGSAIGDPRWATNAGGGGGDQPCNPISGICGADGNTNVTWLLCDSILTIGGDGWMADYNEDTNIAPWYEYRDQIAEVYIAAGVMNTGDLAFRQMNALRYVDLATTVVSLGNYSFYNCPSLHSLTLPESVTSVGQNTPFGGNTTITSPVYNSHVFVRLPQDYAGEYSVEDGTTVIAPYAFKGCNMLSSVVLPSTVTSLGTSAFEDCSALAAVNIPDGVTTLDAYTFSGCSSLRTIDLPASVSSLASYCFAECTYIESITCRATTPPEANGSTFSGVNYMIPIYVPQSSLEQYPSAEGWSGFTDYRAIGETPACDSLIASGYCGVSDNLRWEISCDSIFTLSGTGAMKTGDDEKWFDLRMSIKKVIIGDGITDLVSYAFRQAENIQEVIIGEGVTKIGNSAFWGCSGIQTLVLPSTLDTIEEQGFRSCIDIRIIDLPAGLKHLGEGAFAYCSYYDSLICRAVTPPTTDSDPFYQVPTTKPLYVPARSVALYRSADGWKNFTNILPLRDCITASGECGAEGDNVTWELTCDSVMYISGTGAMANYNTNFNGQAPWAEYGPQISEIIIEEGVTSISPYGFYNAGSYTNGAYNNVHSVTIPSTVSTLANNYFYQCPLLTVTINSDTIVGKGSYSSSGSLQKIFGAQVRQYIIGEGVTAIASSAFHNQSADSLRSIVLPEGITSIGTWAFGYLENLDSIILPSTLQTIDADAFYGSGLKHITIPAGVTAMGGQAFQNCDKLTSVTMQEGLTQIGTSAFANCTALPEITIPESIETISSGAFTGCTNLKKITVLSATWVAETKSSSSTTKQALGGYVRELILGGNITTIGKYAFTSLDSLRRVSFPSSLTVIGEYAFSSCKSLQSVILPNSVTTIANYAFNGCTALDSIQLSDGLLRIGTSAFYQCTSLSRLTLPESLKAINSTAFYQCTGLTEMIIPSGVDSLGTNIFGGCTNLAKLTINSNDLCSQTYSTSTNIKSAFNQDAIKTYIIGEGVTRIGKYAFYNAPMTALVLPSTLTSVDQGSFGSCTSLTRVTCNAYAPPTLQSNTFTKQDTLIIPCEAKASYRAAQYWSSFSPIMCDGQQDMTFNLTSAWTFLMLPNAFSMSAEDIVIDGEVEWGTYNGSLRAMGRSGWENYDAAAVYMCSQALIVRATNGTATLTFTVPWQATNRVGTTMTLYYHEALHEQNANWNFIGNPYPYSYNIMSALEAAEIEAPIAVWNGTAYSLYTPGLDEYVLQPFQAFFIQLPDDGPTVLNLSADYIVE